MLYYSRKDDDIYVFFSVIWYDWLRLSRIIIGNWMQLLGVKHYFYSTKNIQDACEISEKRCEHLNISIYRRILLRSTFFLEAE